MAFLPYSYDDGQPLPFEYFPLYDSGSGSNIHIGEGMALSNGALSVSNAPKYICMREATSVANGTTIPVIPVSGGMVFEAPLKVNSANLAVGSTADVAADGLSISNTSNAASLRITGMDGTAAGDLCRCRFIV